MKFSKKLGSFILESDIFGHRIGVNYKGRDTYQTYLGSICTLAVYVLILINFLQLSTAYHDGSRQTEKEFTTTIDPVNRETVNFSESNIEMFLVKTNNLDASIGRFVVNQVTCQLSCDEFYAIDS